MKMKLVKTFCFVAVLLTALVSGAIASTVADCNAGGTFNSWHNVVAAGGCVTQVFTVPVGYIGTEFDFYCEAGSRNADGYWANLAIYPLGSYTLLGLQSTSSAVLTSNGTQSGGWLVDTYGSSGDNTTSLSLAPGTYACQMWGSGGSFPNYLHAALFTGCTYNGYAADGWAPGAQIGTNQDFQARVTLQAVPEPGSLAALAMGLTSLGGMLLRRRSI